MRRGLRRLSADQRRFAPWEIACAPDRRLRVVMWLFAIPLCVVFLRLVDVVADGPSWLVTSGPVRSVLEPIPARDGRILSADGQVLAEDIETFSVLVHYRWIERPVDPTWLRGQALSGLSRTERRDREAIAAAEQAILDRRESLWDTLAQTTGLSRNELFVRFAEIQEEVTTLQARVIAARESKGESKEPSADAVHYDTWWQAAGQAVWKAVTSSPRPAAVEPLILAEELDHHEIVGGLPISVAARIESSPEQFPGVRIRVASRRRYPQGSIAAHVIGYRFATTDRAGDETGAEPHSRGQTGIERAYDRHLCGVDGLRRVWLDRQGEAVRSEIVRTPRVGRDIVLRLDLSLQRQVEQHLEAALAAVHADPRAESPVDDNATAEAIVPESAGGCVVVLDVRTGALLAAASAPRFDLELAAGRDGRFWKESLADPRRPLFDRVASAAVPPGSIIKIVTAAALLESGRVDPDDPFQCIGYLDRPERHRAYIFRHFGIGHGPTTLTNALAESCNVYFFHHARTVGAAALLEWADRFGFGRKTGSDLLGESAGHVSPAARGADVLGLAIGQADLTATPLQVARLTAAVANGGRLITPHVVRGTGPVHQGTDPVRPILLTEALDEMRQDTLARIREGLEQVVAHPRGTGYKTVRHPQIEIAGKTGTAEVGGSRADHAWFAGYAPADDPQVAVVVLLEHGGSGGQAAGPLARLTFDALLERGLLQP